MKGIEYLSPMALYVESLRKQEEEAKAKRAAGATSPSAPGLKCGGPVKRMAKGGSVDDNEVFSNLPEKNATEQRWEGRKKRPTEARKPDPKMVKDAVDRGAIRKYAKGGAVRGDGCCIKGKSKGRLC